MLITVHLVARNYLMGSGAKDIGEDEAEFIQYAFARCAEGGGQRASIDEPLALLAFIRQWMPMNTGPGQQYKCQSLYGALAQELRVNTADKQNGFEKFIAFSLDVVFSKERRLNQVFTFHGTVPAWADKKAELVSVFCDGTGEVETGKTSFSGSMTPSVTLGVDAKNESETVSWMRHRDRATFCFPQEAMRVDILFVLRLTDDKSLIWVALQSRWCESREKIFRGTFLDAVESVTPSKYFLAKVCVQPQLTRTRKTHPFVRRMGDRSLDMLIYATAS